MDHPDQQEARSQNKAALVTHPALRSTRFGNDLASAAGVNIRFHPTNFQLGMGCAWFFDFLAGSTLRVGLESRGSKPRQLILSPESEIQGGDDGDCSRLRFNLFGKILNERGKIHATGGELFREDPKHFRAPSAQVPEVLLCRVVRGRDAVDPSLHSPEHWPGKLGLFRGG